MIFQLQLEGYKVILAHPERYPFMNMEDYEDLQSRSVFMQLNLLSLIGHYGRDVQNKANMMIEQELISFVGLIAIIWVMLLSTKNVRPQRPGII